MGHEIRSEADVTSGGAGSERTYADSSSIGDSSSESDVQKATGDIRQIEVDGSILTDGIVTEGVEMESVKRSDSNVDVDDLNKGKEPLIQVGRRDVGVTRSKAADEENGALDLSCKRKHADSVNEALDLRIVRRPDERVVCVAVDETPKPFTKELENYQREIEVEDDKEVRDKEETVTETNMLNMDAKQKGSDKGVKEIENDETSSATDELVCEMRKDEAAYHPEEVEIHITDPEEKSIGDVDKESDEGTREQGQRKDGGEEEDVGDQNNTSEKRKPSESRGRPKKRVRQSLKRYRNKSETSSSSSDSSSSSSDSESPVKRKSKFEQFEGRLIECMGDMIKTMGSHIGDIAVGNRSILRGLQQTMSGVREEIKSLRQEVTELREEMQRGAQKPKKEDRAKESSTSICHQDRRIFNEKEQERSRNKENRQPRREDQTEKRREEKQTDDQRKESETRRRQQSSQRDKRVSSWRRGNSYRRADDRKDGRYVIKR